MEVETDDSKHLYEVEQDYEGKNDFPHRPIANLQIHDTVSNTGKFSLYILLGIQVVVILILIILLGINGVTLTHLNTVEMCDNTGGGGPANEGISNSNQPNCTIVQNTWTNEAALNNTALQGQISQLDDILNSKIDRLLNRSTMVDWRLSNIASFVDEQLLSNQNVMDLLYQLLESASNSTNRLSNIISSLANLQALGISTSSVVDDILLIVEDLLELQNGSIIFNSIRPVSCKDIKAVLPNSPTGYYHVNSRTIYCNMDTLCGSGGGWTRIGYLNMKDATQNCPPNFRYYQTSDGIRACGRLSGAASCVSVDIPTNGINYTQICGRVIGYEQGTPDAVAPGPNHNNLNSYYVDGVSITRGSPREHVWTFMTGFYSNTPAHANCPCNTNAYQANLVQSFVGSYYYCESGNPNSFYVFGKIYNDPLWDGQNCPSLEAPCCTSPDLPWFHRDYGNMTSNENLELRVCGDEGWGNEDSPIELYEIYVK